MSKIENGGLGLYGIEHSKCNLLMTLGFKGLILYQVSLEDQQFYITELPTTVSCSGWVLSWTDA